MEAFETAMNKVLSNEKFRKSVAEHAPQLFIAGTGHDEMWNVLSSR
jgi:hypothetical protein